MHSDERRSRGVLVLGIAVLLAVVLGACNTNREVTTPEPLPITDELLEASLLTDADLPGTWATEGGDAISADVVPGHDCDDAITELEPKAAASASFTRDGVVLTDVTAWFPNQGRAVEERFRALLDDCRSVVVPDADIAARAASLDFGVLSDDTLPIRVELEPTTGPILELDLIVMRRGDLLHLIRLDGPRPSDKTLLDTVVRVAIGRLGRLHQDTS